MGLYEGTETCFACKGTGVATEAKGQDAKPTPEAPGG